MKVVTLSPDGRRLYLKFTDGDFAKSLAFVKTLQDWHHDALSHRWSVGDTRNNESKLMADKWRFIGDAYCEIRHPVELKPRALLNVDRVRDYTAEGLRPYQNDAVYAIKDRRDRAILSMPPGTGKTCMAVKWLDTLNRDRILVVCPAFLKTHWERDLLRWGDIKAVAVFTRSPYDIPDHVECVIINYDILYDWAPTLVGKFDTIICDESHYLVNEDAKRTQAVQMLSRAEHLLFMTGTPIRSKVYQFLPVLRMLDAKIFKHELYFKHKFCGPYVDVKKSEIDFSGLSHAEELFELLKHYMVRKTKEEVLPDLPRKNRIMYEVTVPSDKLLRSLAEDLDTMEDLARQKQEAMISRTGYFLKKEFIFDLVERLYEAVGKVVVVAFHHDVIDDLLKAFPSASVIDGRVPAPKRQELVDAFNRAEEAIIILQTQAGGVGFSLETAHDMVIAELIWTHGELEQVEDRIHRFTSTGDQVNYFYPVVVDTIEEAMYRRIETNSSNASEALDGTRKSHFAGRIKEKINL